MKFYVALFLSILPACAVFAQKGLPAFGKVEKEELEMKSCDFDPDAEAMYLYDVGEVTFDAGVSSPFAIRNERRVRIKIFNEKGFPFASVKIPYISDERFERLENISAATYNLSETGSVVKTEVEKKVQFKEQLNKSWAAITFAFPDVKPGSIIEYKYTTVRQAFSRINPWIFQASVPVKESYFRIVFPEYFRFSIQHLTTQPYEKSQQKINQSLRGRLNLNFTGEEYIYRMTNIPALRDEPFMRAERDYLQRVEFQLSQIILPDEPIYNLSNTWKSLAADLLEHPNFGEQLRRNISLPKEIDQAIKAAPDKTAQLRIIHDYIRRNFEWNGEADIYTDGVKNVFASKGGTNADLNLMMLNILRDYKIESYPLLVSTRDNGKVTPFYPFLDQFNKVIILAVADNRYYIINAADRFNAMHIIPYDVLGTTAFLIDKNNARLVDLWNDNMVKGQTIIVSASIDNDNVIAGQSIITSKGYARNPLVKSYKQSPENFLKTHYQIGIAGLSLDSLEVENIDEDSLPLTQKFLFKHQVGHSGEYHYFNLNMFTDLQKNPFVKEKRYTDIDFGHKQSYLITGRVEIPENAEFEALPKNIQLIMPDTSIVFRRVIQKDENALSFRINIDFLSPMYPVENYETFREFYKRLFALLNEQVVYKKKT